MNKRLEEAIDQVIQEILVENPAVVLDKRGNRIIDCDTGPAVAFKLFKDDHTGKIEVNYRDTRSTRRAAWHGEIHVTASGMEILRGRLWNIEKIASFYQGEKIVEPYRKDIEKFFSDIGEDITTYRWDFDDSSELKGLIPWPWKPGYNPTGPAIQISPEIQQKINDLLPQFHLATPGPEKDKLKKELDDLYKQAGVENEKELQSKAYQKASGKKKTPFEKGGGAGMASYRGRLPALQEDPDTVKDKQDHTIASVYVGPAIAFYCLEDKTRGIYKWFYNRNDHGEAWHNGIDVRSTPEFPDPWGTSNSRYLRGRIWQDIGVCSFYFNENQFGPKEVERVEELFSILGLDIDDFQFEFNNSARTEGLKPWPFTAKKPKKTQVSPEEQEKIDAINKQIGELQATLHLKVGDEKIKVEKEIERLGAMVGKIGGMEARKAAYRKAGAEKKTPFEKGGGGSLAGYKGRLPAIAEDKVRLYNKTLCPLLWTQDRKLVPEVRKALLEIALDFYTDTELKGKIQDVQLLGSAANYNWTPKSDLDVHILVDGSEVSMQPEEVEKYFRAMVGKWNLEHDIVVKGHPVELYLQDIHEENAATGVYSLTKDQWVKDPTPEKVSVDRVAVQKKYTMWVEKINDAIKSSDEKKLKKILEGLRTYRQAGLDENGEFSTENIVFKILRARGFLEKLKESMNSIYDKKHSVKDGFEPTSQGPNPGAGQTEDSNGQFYQRTNDRMRQMEEGVLGMIKDTGVGVELRQLLAKYNHGNIDPDKFGKELERIMWKARGSDPENFALAKNTLDRWNASMKEGIGMKDLKSRHPQHSVMTDNPEFEKLTLDNLKALRDKATRFYAAAKAANDKEEIENARAAYQMFHDEIKKRLQYINKPMEEGTIDWKAWEKEKYGVEGKDWVGIPEPGSNRMMMAKIQQPEQGKTKSSMTGYGGDRDQAHGRSSEPRKFEENRDDQIWLGWVDPSNHRVIASSGEEASMHDHLYNTHPETQQLDFEDAPKWRFRKDLNTVYWWSQMPDEDIRESLDIWLQKNLRVSNPKHVRLRAVSWDEEDKDNVRYSHGTMEENSTQENRLVLRKAGDVSGIDPKEARLLGSHRAITIGNEIFGIPLSMWDQNKWGLNRWAGAFRLNFPDWNKTYDTPEALVDDLNKYLESHKTTNEGYGAGIPEQDRLKITNSDCSVRRWQIKSKDAPKTPKLPDSLQELVNEALDSVLPDPKK